MSRSYEVMRASSGHLDDPAAVAVAASAVVGVWAGPLAALVLALVAGVARRSKWLMVCGVLVGLVGAVASLHAWEGSHPCTLGVYAGWAQLATDPAPIGAGLRLTLEIRGERFDAWVYGGTADRLADRQSGEWVLVRGTRTPLAGDGRRERIRHVVGRFRLDLATDTSPGTPLVLAGNRVRSALRRTAGSVMPGDLAALFTGLVIGDDARQPPAMVEAFRASGLSHLTAVSGQNVAFLLAAALPLLRRLRPWWRWAATVSLIAWFMAVTRFEPSVLRAGLMAMLAATAFVLGRRPQPIRLLAVSVTMLVVIDPMLVWSVGFWLSVGATAGVCVAGPWWASRLPGPEWWRASVGVTLGAQMGVALPSVLVFGRLPLVSLVANLVAVPVAGGVMLYGLPAGLLASWLPSPLARVVMLPAVVGTRWVAVVARVAAAVEPPAPWSWVGWCLLLALLAAALRHRSRVDRPRVPI